MTPGYSSSNTTLTIRGVFIVFNVLFSVISLSLLSLGLALVVTQVDVTVIAGNDLYTGGTIVTIAGALAFLLSLLGIVAAACKIRVLLGAYIFVLVVTLILCEAGGLIGLLYKPYIIDFPTYFRDTMEKYYPPDDLENYIPSSNNAIDYYQNTYRCCGCETAHDWENYSVFLNSSSGQLPPSCSCDASQGDNSCIYWEIAYNGSQVKQPAWSKGCSDVAMSELSSSTYALAIVGVVSGILQVPGLILAIALIVLISRNRFQGYIQI